MARISGIADPGRSTQDLVQTPDDLHNWKAQIPGEPRLEFAALWCTLEQAVTQIHEVCMRPLTLSLMVLLVMAATLGTEAGAATNSRHRHYGHPQHSYRGGEHQRFGSHHWWDQQRRRRR